MALIGGVDLERSRRRRPQAHVGRHLVPLTMAGGFLKWPMAGAGVADGDRTGQALAHVDAEDTLHGARPFGVDPDGAVAEAGAHLQSIIGHAVEG